MNIINIILSVFLLVTTGCSQKLFKASYIKKNSPSDPVLLPKAPELKTTDTTEDCVITYLLFPNKLRWNREELYKNICPKSEDLHHVKIEREFFLVPLIYGRDCIVMTAECGK